MQRTSEDAARFNRSLSNFAERLAGWDIVVSRLHADWSSFGSWEFWLQRGSAADHYGDAIASDPGHAIPPDVLRCLWDGRDGFLMIETSPCEPLSAPNEWSEEHAKGFDTSEEALKYVEGYLKRRFKIER